MTKEQILHELKDVHQLFGAYIDSLVEEDFMFSHNHEKWTAGQQADHIFRSVSPLKTGLILPLWLLKLVFDKANRASKSYEELVNKYMEKLNSGAVASGKFIPKAVEFSRKKELVKNINQTVSKICNSLQKYSEQELDSLALPHPLLGKITLREMMYFTIHHAKQHLEIAQRNLESKKH